MEIAYFDIGYGKGLTGSITSVESEEYNPYSGVAFTGSGNIYFRSPFPYSSTSKYVVQCMCLKFNFYQNSTTNFSAGFFSSTSTNLNTSDERRTAWVSITPSRSYYRSRTQPSLQPLISGLNNGFHEVVINTCMYYTSFPYELAFFDTYIIDGETVKISSPPITTAVDGTYSSPGQGFAFECGNTGYFYISNVIFAKYLTTYDTIPTTAEEAIKPLLKADQIIVRLPLNVATESTFIPGENGEYIANTAGQELLSTIDAQDVIEKYGAASKVHHLIRGCW